MNMKSKKVKPVKKSEFRRQMTLSFLFTAGFVVFIASTMAQILLGSYVIEQFSSPDSYAQEVFYYAALVFMILGMGFAFAALFTYVLLSPLNDIMDAADKVAKGDYSVRVAPRGFGYLQDLGEKFNHMTEEIASVEELRNDFINNFSHEFKTPIVSIRGFAKMLQRDDLSEEERQEYLHIIIKESERLAELSNNVLALSKIEKQAILKNVTRYNASEQIRLAIALLDSKWTDKTVNFVFDSSDVYVTGNEELLNQVWINLLDNAIKFSPENGTVHIQTVTEPNATRFLFTNCGAPIPADKTPYIFDKFFQSDLSHATQGNGIGLALVKKITELHKGEVRLVHSDETGTVFEVVLPHSAPANGKGLASS